MRDRTIRPANTLYFTPPANRRRICFEQNRTSALEPINVGKLTIQPLPPSFNPKLSDKT